MTLAQDQLEQAVYQAGLLSGRISLLNKEIETLVEKEAFAIETVKYWTRIVGLESNDS